MDIQAHRAYFAEIALNAQKALTAIDNGTAVVEPIEAFAGNWNNNLSYLATSISGDAASLCQQLGVEPWSYYN